MLKWCRIALAATMALSAAGVAVAEGEADGGLESRLRALESRFGQRQQHSEAALRLRPVGQTVRAALNDLIVNNDGFGGASNQWELVLARQPDGGTIAVWTDDRDANLSVYGQVFDSLGTPLGPNFRLHPDPGNRDQSDPAIVVRSDGGFYGAFTDLKADGDRDVIVQRFSRLGQRLGAQINAAIPADTAAFVQRNPALTLLSTGEVVVLYEQDHLTNPNSDVYGQLIAVDAPIRIGRKFVVSKDLEVGGGSVLYDEREPSVAAGGNDTIWAAWTDNRDGGVRDVFVQRLFRVATDTVRRIGALGKVNDEPVSANTFQKTPRVVASDNGDAFVLWGDFRNGNWDVYMQSYAASGARQGVNRRVNSDATSTDQGSPALALVDTSSVGVWLDFREGTARVYAQRFRFYDSVYVTHARWEPSYDSVLITHAHISDLGGGNYEQCDSMWIIRHRTPDDTLFSRTNCTVTSSPDSTRDTTKNEFFKVCDSVWVAGAGQPVNCDTIPAADTAGLVTTTTISKKSGLDGTNFAVGPAGTGNQKYPAVGLSPNAVFAAGWTQPDALASAYFRLVDAANVPDTPMVMAEIVISAKQEKPACAIGSGGDIFTVWEESRAALPNVVGQALNAGLSKPQSDRQVNDGPDVFHFLPTTSVGGSLGFAVWEDYRDTIQPVYSDIYMQRYSLTASGYTSEGMNVRVIDTVESQEVRLASWSPDIASADNGNAMVVWQDNRFDSWDVFAARYSDSVSPVTGNPVRLGTNFRVDEAPYFTQQQIPRIDMNGAGRTVVVWEDTRNGPYEFEIWARIYNAAGQTAVGPEKQLAINSAHTPREPDVAVNTDGSFAVVYEDHSNPLDVDIYFQRFSATGDTGGTAYHPILINDDGLAVHQFLPRVAATAQGYVVVWQDERAGNWDIYACLVPTGASAANPNYLVNDAETTDQTVPAIAARRTDPDPFICWEDLRVPNTAPDIFGNRNTPTLATGVDDDGDDGAILPGQFGLDQNYPNPFNPSTEIRYVLATPARVELTVYNALGQRVRTLVQSSQMSGEHRIVWDGSDEQGQAVASGTYFYRLRWSEGEITRKMTLLR